MVVALALLGGAFRLSEDHSPPVLAGGQPEGACPVAGLQTCAQCLAQVRRCRCMLVHGMSDMYPFRRQAACKESFLHA